CISSGHRQMDQITGWICDYLGEAINKSLANKLGKVVVSQPVESL
ncbi:26864_t:CDS:1, partial [Dentiscutata erythropus]